MKWNKKLAMTFGCLAAFPAAFAGTMGSANVMGAQHLTPYIIGEGFPVWVDFGGITLTTNTSTDGADKGNMLSGGGRIAAGVALPYRYNIDFIAESGWNYFGSTSGDISDTKFSATLSGVDFLVGAVYKQNNFEWFGKVGTLFQRVDYKLSFPSTYVMTLQTTDVYGAVNAKINLTDVLPEVKLGVMYDINPHWAASLAYMHAFGDAPKMNAGYIKPQSTLIQDFLRLGLKGATLNALQIGLRYQFI